MIGMAEYQQIIENAARQGGAIIQSYFGQELTVTEKKTIADLRTKADTEAEGAIIKEITSHFPDYNILTEEQENVNNGSDYTFIIDPLDGSNNFVTGISYFSVAMALIKSDQVIAGVVYNPIVDHMYFAAVGQGITLNGKKLQVNSVDQLTRTTVSSVANYQTWPKQVGELMQTLGKHNIKRVLNTWSPALDFCLLATGRIEAVSCAVTAHDEFYDYAIGKFMASEGGAKITNLDGSEDHDIKNGLFLATNGTKIHENLLNIFYPNDQPSRARSAKLKT